MGRDEHRSRKRGRAATTSAPSTTRYRNTNAAKTPQRAAAIIVAVAALIASAACLPNAFTGDDIQIIVQSQRLHGLAHLGEILTLPYWPAPFVPDLYRPVTSILLATQYAAGDGDPFVFRIISVALYVATCALVWRVASRLFTPRLALWLGLLFAVHPVHVEAVANAVGQGELIVALLSVYALDRYIRARRSESGQLDRRDWTRIGTAYAFACLAKENGFLLPALLIAAELLLFQGEPVADRARRLWRGFVAVGAVGVACLALRTAILNGKVGTPAPAETFMGIGTPQRLLTMLRVVPEWLRLLVWPAHLRIDYRPPDFAASTGFHAMELFGALLLVAGIAAAAWARTRQRPIAFGLAFFALAILPVANVIVPSGIVLAERTLLLPSVGLMIAVFGALALLQPRAATDVAWSRAALAAGACLVLLGLGRSIKRQLVWRNQNTLMEASVVDDPRNWYVWQGYAETLFAAQRFDESFDASRAAIARAPNKSLVRNEFAAQLHAVGRDADAEAQLRASLAEAPHQVLAVAALPPVLIAQGKYAEAIRIADSVIVAEHAPTLMVLFRHVADSALKVGARPGSIRLPVPIH